MQPNHLDGRDDNHLQACESICCISKVKNQWLSYIYKNNIPTYIKGYLKLCEWKYVYYTSIFT